MLVLSFGMVAVMEMQTALRAKRNVERLVYFFLEVGIYLCINKEQVEALDCLGLLSIMVCKPKLTNLKNVSIIKSYAH